MKPSCYTNHRIGDVVLSTLAIILVCCIDAKAQSTIGVEFFMNDTTEGLDVVAAATSASDSSSGNTSPHHSSRGSSRGITQIDSGASSVATFMNNETDSDPIVVSSSSSSSSVADINTTSLVYDRLPASQAQVMTMAAVNEESPVTTPSVEIGNFSSTTVSATNRPFVLPFTIPTLRPRVVHQRPYSKHHHDHLWGPFFEEPANNGTLHVGFHLGTEAILNCRVGMLKDKTVMWLQRTTEKVSLLTVGNVTYSGDPRVGVKFQYPNNWRLHINPLRHEDGGMYMCQVSTHPPKVFATNLTVLAPAVRVVDEMGYDVNDRYYKLGSLVDITCQVAVSYLATLPPVASEGPKSIKAGANVIDLDSKEGYGGASKERLHYLNHKIEWKKDGESLPADVKISLSISKNWKNSRLTILHAYKSHSGTYTCTVFNASTAAAHVQVLNGETPAAVQHNTGSASHPLLLLMLIFIGLLSGVPKVYCSSAATTYISTLC